MERFRVTDEDGGVRIDKYLTSVCEGLSRSYLQKLLKSGQVLVGGQGVKASYAVQEGDLIELEVPEAVEPEILAEPMDLDVLYEDEDIILINKPKGMVVHPAAGHYTHTLVNGLLDHCRGQLSGINGVMRPGIVHRIDMDTTGVIIACKNDLAHSCLAEQLKEHSITRRYQAIVHGVLKEDEGTVDAPIGRHPVERKKMSINYNNGREAVTHYKVLRRFRQYTHVECRLETGRTHQIRVHMASIHHPLLGDAVYGPARCPIPGLQGQTLHAGVLGIRHPRTGAYMEFTAPLPDYFAKLLRTLPE
ncbi:RluA family pseudouridine synthase [Clostridium sp. AF18-27]|uniref:Pseudouridine synthase n=1 Tax=Enterocloster lavalensis TaxID=460384 RepID=A0A1I0B4E9_9FIRM|nr:MULTISPECIES: RluA family pseudouridine synthase [Enterocloster]MBS5604031.1 RluA family pseudouridine synthase [Enterocloster asparagiformis]RHR57184.1 RluA family pseudouridine synthase [Clostridium sp. AF18-27]MDR3759655.1 RluA family pseudouridine synthase [Enterocloster sp.]PST31194.1 RluA family pseudouridine synthase [Enterocloster lavalensis]SET01666.1 23S rRNA pseudouridine1911/1915/1917 synthase [Enterocloster lavalensis]